MNGVLPVSFLCTSMFSDAQDIFLLNMKAEKKKKPHNISTDFF